MIMIESLCYRLYKILTLSIYYWILSVNLVSVYTSYGMKVSMKTFNNL